MGLALVGSLALAGLLSIAGCGDDRTGTGTGTATGTGAGAGAGTGTATGTGTGTGAGTATGTGTGTGAGTGAGDPLAGMDEPPTPSEYAGVPAGEVAVGDVPPGACVALTEAPQRVWPRPGVPAITVLGERFHLALHGGGAPGDEADELHLVSASPETEPTPIRSLRINPAHGGGRIAPPAITVDGDELVVAFIDGQGHVRLGSTDPARPSANLRTIEAGSGADVRFAPAVAVVRGTRVVAWTDGTGTPMRVRVARADRSGVLLGTHDVTMAGMGAATPTFAAGASTPTLYFIDARAGISPIVKAELRPDGSPRPSSVARPVGTVSVPPELAVGVTGDGHAFAGYTAIGNMATTAVGLMPLFGDVATALPLVPGTGYGPLNVAAAAGPAGVVFAADAPRDQPPNAPREIHLRVMRSGAPGPTLTITGPDGTGRHAAIARRADGVLGVAFSAPDGVYVAWARCDD
ncbi:MAG: hypothetical protein JRH11_09175 [Deltaproteobacteria bacterium]|nr:hypothetical protein [Deltaproteobacteria bacterium]